MPHPTLSVKPGTARASKEINPHPVNVLQKGLIGDLLADCNVEFPRKIQVVNAVFEVNQGREVQ